MKYYKIIENGKVIQLGTSNALLPDAIEILKSEYEEILESMTLPMEEEPEPTPSEFDLGFESGYEQAILDMLELEFEEESEE